MGRTEHVKDQSIGWISASIIQKYVVSHKAFFVQLNLACGDNKLWRWQRQLIFQIKSVGLHALSHDCRSIATNSAWEVIILTEVILSLRLTSKDGTVVARDSSVGKINHVTSFWKSHAKRNKKFGVTQFELGSSPVASKAVFTARVDSAKTVEIVLVADRTQPQHH